MFLETFRLPGEAPVIQHVLEHFAESWHVRAHYFLTTFNLQGTLCLLRLQIIFGASIRNFSVVGFKPLDING